MNKLKISSLRLSVNKINSSNLSSASEALIKTKLYDLHVSLGGKMVPFAGYELPVQYDQLGVLKEHIHTRSVNSASLFDVSHMGQIKWHGKDAVKFLEKMVVSDLQSLKVGEAKLSLIMNENGGYLHLYIIFSNFEVLSADVLISLYLHRHCR